jgi:hypothetical protein
MTTVSPETRVAFQIASGICWTLTYILIIRRGFLDKTYGMPLAALCANVSWEFIFAFLILVPAPQNYVNVVWFGFDAVIVFQFLRYGRSGFKGTLADRYFYPLFVLSLAVAFGGVLTVSYEFHDLIGKYAAFSQNLMMSILFVVMLVRRNNVSGQSLYIALLKMIGTLFPSVLFFMIDPSAPFMDYLFVTIFAFDLIYVVALYARLKEAGIKPWTRF